jgi:hypothetical protein
LNHLKDNIPKPGIFSLTAGEVIVKIKACNSSRFVLSCLKAPEVPVIICVPESKLVKIQRSAACCKSFQEG